MITERNVGKGKIILVGSVISGGDLLRLVGRASIAEASENVVLVERSGNERGMIAVEIEDKSGYLVLDGKYTDLITGKNLTGKIEVSPYEVLVLKKGSK